MTLPPTDPAVPYTQIRSTLGTGDLVFLHGTSPAGVMIENIEKGLDWPPYSHVGMVIRDGDDLYFWDAPGGGDCFPDPYAGDPDNRIYGNKVHTGCRVSVLDDVLAYYATKTDVHGFWFRQLTSGVSDSQFAALRLFINRVDGQPFPAGPGSDPAVSGLGMNFVAGQDRASMFFGTYFCAQLVADSYMRMGLLAMEAFPANGYSPAAFGMDDPVRFPLVKPAAVGASFFVSWDLPTGSGTPCDQ
jgi:hypothetical protein